MRGKEKRAIRRVQAPLAVRQQSVPEICQPMRIYLKRQIHVSAGALRMSRTPQGALLQSQAPIGLEVEVQGSGNSIFQPISGRTRREPRPLIKDFQGESARVLGVPAKERTPITSHHQAHRSLARQSSLRVSITANDKIQWSALIDISIKELQLKGTLFK